MQTEINWSRGRKSYKKLENIFVSVIPLVFYLIPVSWLDSRHSICLFKNIFGVKCYGCGITRAIICALHFDFERSYHYNKLVLIVLPLLVYVWVKEMIRIYAHAYQEIKRFCN